MNRDVIQRKRVRSGRLLLGFLLALTILARTASAQATDSKPAEQNASPEINQIIYLNNATDQNSINDIQTALRTSLPRTRFFAVQSVGAISVHGTADDVATAQKIVSELDRPRKTYRLTYKITETDGGQPEGSQHVTLIVVSGSKTDLKQGDRVPIVTGVTRENNTEQDQVQYQDVGLGIEATLSGSSDALNLLTRIDVSSLTNPAAAAGQRDPTIHQNVLSGLSTIVLGKPLVLGSLDIPGSTRHEEVEVVAELVR